MKEPNRVTLEVDRNFSTVTVLRGDKVLSQRTMERTAFGAQGTKPGDFDDDLEKDWDDLVDLLRDLDSAGTSLMRWLDNNTP